MSERISMHELDAALEAWMADPDAPPPTVGPELAELLGLAGELRDLPDAAFRARLAAQLLARAREATQAGASPAEPVMDFVPHDLAAALTGLPDASMRFFATLDRATVGVTRFSETLAWERHPDGDELLHLLAGEAEITTLTDAGPQRTRLCAGSLFVCPRGLWHQIAPRTPVSMLFATPGEGTEHSDADDPRQPGARAHARAPGAEAALVAHDLGAALAGMAPLSITARTTSAEADAAFRPLARFAHYTLGVMRFAGRTPWERHPDGDELLHALDGEVDVSLLADDGPRRVRLRAGSVLVCPRGLWHRQLAAAPVTMLFATVTETSQVSFADDPRSIHPQEV
jgi:quercetin dioxygenase-like cupin family protein